MGKVHLAAHESMQPTSVHRVGRTEQSTVPYHRFCGRRSLSLEGATKLAAMELEIDSERRSALTIGGVIIDGRVRFGLDIPVLGSLISRAIPTRQFLACATSLQPINPTIIWPRWSICRFKGWSAAG